MPSGYLHKLCAQQAAARAGIAPLVGEAFTLGAQGPDPLFSLHMFPLRLSSRPHPYAGILHKRRTGAHLLALLSQAKAEGAAERSYAMGFLTHYALDSTVHPYVYARSVDARGKYVSALHMRLEKHWDALYYRRDGGKGTPLFMPGVKEARPYWQAIARVWSRAILAAYPELSVDEAMLMEAFAAAEHANQLTHSNTGVKYALVWCLERVIGKPGYLTSQITPRFPSKKDIENSAGLPWRSAAEPGRERTEGLSELFEAAVLRAEELLCAAQAYFNDNLSEQALAATIGNAGYDTGAEALEG